MQIDILVAILASIINPIIVIWLTARVNRMKQERELAEAAAKEAPAEARAMRDELRAESVRQKSRADKLEDDLDEMTEENERLNEKLIEWRKAFYVVKTEKTKIEFELQLMRQEIAALRVQVAKLQETKEQIDEFANGDE